MPYSSFAPTIPVITYSGNRDERSEVLAQLDVLEKTGIPRDKDEETATKKQLEVEKQKPVILTTCESALKTLVECC